MEQAIETNPEQLEALKAVAARVRRALQLLEAGDHEKAKTLLRSTERTLPAHERRHWMAAGVR